MHTNTKFTIIKKCLCEKLLCENKRSDKAQPCRIPCMYIMVFDKVELYRLIYIHKLKELLLLNFVYVIIKAVIDDN